MPSYIPWADILSKADATGPRGPTDSFGAACEDSNLDYFRLPTRDHLKHCLALTRPEKPEVCQKGIEVRMCLRQLWGGGVSIQAKPKRNR